MNREWVIAGIVALLCHGLLLFGLRLESAAVALPVGDTAVEVSLVEGVPAAAATVAVTEPPAEPPPVASVPLPPVQPPDPVPPAPVPEPSPEIRPEPRPPTQPIRHELARPARPNVPASTAGRPGAVTHSGVGTAPSAGAADGTRNSSVREVYNPKPEYPAEADRMHIVGRVGLSLEVGADGHVLSVTVKRSSGYAILDNAAVQGVKRWRFEPARVAGIAVVGHADVPVVFLPPGAR